MPTTIGVGDVVSVNSLRLSRRDWLKCLAGAGAGTVGLKSAIEQAAGASVNGVPLVLTRDEQRNPDRVRIVSEERYETLQRYQNLNVEEYFERFDGLNGITVTPPGNKRQPYEAESGLEFKFFFDSSPGATLKRKIPNRIGKMPVHTEKRTVKGRVRQCRTGVINDPVGGGSYVYVDQGGGFVSEGTVGVVGYLLGNNWEVITTAGHVAEESFNIDDRIWQAGQLVGERQSYDSGNDIAAYRAKHVDADPGHVVESLVPDVSGSWDYAGLADASAGWGADGPDVELAGAKTCHASTTVYNTEKNNYVDHQINMDDEVGTSGDSGAPYVDNNGNLVALHVGRIQRPVLSDYSYGAAGTESLVAAGVTLAPT